MQVSHIYNIQNTYNIYIHIYIYIIYIIYTYICSGPRYGGMGYDKSMHMWACIYTRLYSHMHLWVHMHMHSYIWVNMDRITPSPVSFAFLATHQHCIHQLKPKTNPIFSHIWHLNTGTTFETILSPQK